MPSSWNFTANKAASGQEVAQQIIMIHWMKSLRFHQFGEPANLEIADLPIP